MSEIVAEVRPPPLEAGRTLVVEDRPLVVDLIELTLTHGNFVVRAASTLAEAEVILTEWQPHMSVVDINLKTTALRSSTGSVSRTA